MKIFRNVKHNFGNEIHDKQNNYENYEFKYDPNVLKSMSAMEALCGRPMFLTESGGYVCMYCGW